MDAIDWILDFAALLLWLNWRSLRFLPHSASALSLLSTLKRAEPRAPIRWLYLVALLALLFFRSVFYWQIGSGVNWTPALDLVAITIPFRSDRFTLMLLYSLAGFLIVLGAFYSWLLLISALNRRVSDLDPLQKLVRLYLGWIDAWPSGAKLLLPPIASGLLWAAANPLLGQLGLVPDPQSAAHLWEQALLLALASLMVWKTFLLGLLLLYILNSYIYLGQFAFLEFVNTTARNLLRIFHGLPLRIGRIDMAPISALLVVLALAELLKRSLPLVYRLLPL